MGNNDIKVKDLSTTSSLSTDNKLMLLTDEANNTVQNITVENALANIISSNANNSLSVGTDKKLYTTDISGEVGDLDNLITTDKTDIVSAINEVKGDTNAITGEVVSASKGWLEEGKIYQKDYWYGEKIYNDVYGYNHSTFDLSKFTKVGSPIITNDGIINNLIYNTNYIKTQYTVPASTANSWAVKINRFKVNSLASGQRLFSFNSNNTFLSIETDGKLKIFVSSSTTGDIANNQYANYTVSLNEVIDVELRFTGTAYEVWVNGVKTYSINSTTKISVDQVFVVYSGGTGYAPCIGEHDLKQFSITVDGIPVFSGNKTGIDTIKPVDYTTVGTPTISADGIASGFSADDYLTTSILSTLSTTQTFKILSKIRFTSSPNGTLFGLENKLRIIYNSTSQRIELRYVTANTIWANSLLYISNSTLPIQVNKDYYIGVEYDGININLIYSTDLGKTWNVASSRAEASGISGISTLGIGRNYNETGYLYGNLDLNAFKIYVDGDLVYQPCLLIPYTESSTGSKIVDVAYRDRVIDVYEQFGSANYYTIDETNQNATLPMGEIYGFIEQKQNSIDNIFEKIVPIYNDNLRIEIGHSAYTTPDNGYIYCPKVDLNASLLLFVQTNASGPVNMVNCGSGAKSSFCLPVPKGARITTTTEDANLHIYFMPAQG